MPHKDPEALRVYRQKRWQTRKSICKDRKELFQLLKIGRPCYDCGGMFSPEVLDWDHRPGTGKRFGLSKMKDRQIETIWAEINKCDLVCANCHRTRTAARDGWRKLGQERLLEPPNTTMSGEID